MILQGLNVQSELIKLAGWACFFYCISNMLSVESLAVLVLQSLMSFSLTTSTLIKQQSVAASPTPPLSYSSNIRRRLRAAEEFPSSSSRSCFNSSHVAVRGGVKLIQYLRA